MHVDDLTSVDPNVDYSQILPIQQKRTIAFINHFVMKTVAFLNHFAQSCESRLMEFEYKLQEVEASLLIMETQLSSISHLGNVESNVTQNSVSLDLNLPEIKEEEIEKNPINKIDDPKYEKFFKMFQFGVPIAAVKLKMQSEGLDPTVLDASEVQD